MACTVCCVPCSLKCNKLACCAVYMLLHGGRRGRLREAGPTQDAVCAAFAESGWEFQLVINCIPLRDPRKDTRHLGFSAHVLQGVMHQDPPPPNHAARRDAARHAATAHVTDRSKLRPLSGGGVTPLSIGASEAQPTKGKSSQKSIWRSVFD